MQFNMHLGHAFLSSYTFSVYFWIIFSWNGHIYYASFVAMSPPSCRGQNISHMGTDGELILDKIYFKRIKKLKSIHLLYGAIADVVVRKCHQRLDKLRIIFTCTSSKSCFQKTQSCNVRPWHLTQSSLHSIHLRAWYKCDSHSIRLL